jgi:hypothetical protein
VKLFWFIFFIFCIPGKAWACIDFSGIVADLGGLDVDLVGDNYDTSGAFTLNCTKSVNYRIYTDMPQNYMLSGDSGAQISIFLFIRPQVFVNGCLDLDETSKDYLSYSSQSVSHRFRGTGKLETWAYCVRIANSSLDTKEINEVFSLIVEDENGTQVSNNLMILADVFKKSCLFGITNLETNFGELQTEIIADLNAFQSNSFVISCNGQTSYQVTTDLPENYSILGEQGNSIFLYLYLSPAPLTCESLTIDSPERLSSSTFNPLYHQWTDNVGSQNWHLCWQLKNDRGDTVTVNEQFRLFLTGM